MSETHPKVPAPNTAAYYDGMAGWGYDKLASEMGWPAKVDGLLKRVFELERPNPSVTMLDLGAGTGLSIDAIRHYSRPERIDAVDASRGMLDLLAQRHTDAGINPILSSMQDYARRCDSTYDMVTSMSALEFVPDLPDFLGSIPRLLNSQGVFAATYKPVLENGQRERVQESPDIGQSLKSYYWTPEEIEQSLSNNGLTIVDKVGLLPAYTLGEETVLYNFIAATKP